MKELDNFKTIFQYTPAESNALLSIEEKGKSAKIRHLNIMSGGEDITLLGEDFSNSWCSHFRKASQCTKNADGVVMFERPTEKVILLCELKSSGSGVFDTAYQQTFSSYIKTCMAMSVCNNFDVTEYKVYFVFTAQESPELAVRQNELEEIDESKRDFYDKVSLSLLKGEEVRFMMDAIPHNLSYLHSSLTHKEVMCKLLTSQTDTIDLHIDTLV
jgi:hypothetical protein